MDADVARSKERKALFVCQFVCNPNICQFFFCTSELRTRETLEQEWILQQQEWPRVRRRQREPLLVLLGSDLSERFLSDYSRTLGNGKRQGMSITLMEGGLNRKDNFCPNIFVFPTKQFHRIRVGTGTKIKSSQNYFQFHVVF